MLLFFVIIAKTGSNFRTYVCLSEPKSTPLSSTCNGRNFGCGKLFAEVDSISLNIVRMNM